MNTIRLSPVVLALLAGSTSLGSFRPVQAAPEPNNVKYYSPIAPEGTTSQPQLISQVQGPNPVTPGQPIPPPGPPTPVSPRPGNVTPQQETPDRIQFDLTPGTQPSIQLPSPTQPATPSAPTAQPSSTDEPRVLIAEVVVSGAQGELEDEVYRVIRTRPGRTATRSELNEDINAVFATGFFSNVRVQPEDTPLGVRVTFVVTPNPVLSSVKLEGTQVLPESVSNNIFSKQYGQTLNLRRLQEGIQELKKWYEDNGYVLAQVIGSPKVSPDGVVTLEVAEGVVEDIQVRFLNKEGEDKNERGEPIQGRTRDFIITREFGLKPGSVFNRDQAQRDLQRIYGLGIFEDVKLSLNPGQDPRQVIVVANVTERNTGSLAAGVGISSASGLFGTVSYQEQNLGGNNQKLGAEVQVGEREVLFNINFTDPWIAGDPNRTAYSVNLFNQRTISLVFDGGPKEVRLSNGDRPRVDRLGGSVVFTRPLSETVTGSLGLQYQRVTIRDFSGTITPLDQQGNRLSFTSGGIDDLLTLQLGVVNDLRDDPLRPTRGSLLRVGTEQSVPVGSGNIFLNRLRGSYSYYIPVQYLNLTSGPQALAFNIQAGTVLGDLPPYEAFSLGGSNSVRGYDEGGVGSGRSFVQATAEYRFPIFSIVGGALFLDAATDLGTGSSVPGNPAGVRGKPGSGFGYGLGVRVQTPLGPLRLDYGFNDQGNSRLQFGIGERF